MQNRHARGGEESTDDCIYIIAKFQCESLSSKKFCPSGEIRIDQISARDAVGIVALLMGADGAIDAIV